jgi:ADP-ribose pyrophosphatase
MHFHQLTKDSPGWSTLKDDAVFANPYLEVHAVELRTPMRPEGAHWTVVHRKAACVIAPMTGAGELLLIRQERIPVRGELWEFPAGQIDVAGPYTEAVVHATALRELREECGYELAPGGSLIPMGMFFSSPGFTDEHAYLFAARPVVVSPKGTDYDDSEAITECRAFSPKALREMIARGEVCDANTLSSFARLTALGVI